MIFVNGLSLVSLLNMGQKIVDIKRKTKTFYFINL